MAFRFLGIGAAKSATTWTYRMLSQHPEVRFPGKKEVNFWTQKSVDEHLATYREMMLDTDPAIAMGEISVSYAVMKERRIQRIHSQYPDLRLFLNVRHPVDRACSRARMLLRAEGRTVESLSPDELDDLVFGSSGVMAGDYPAVLQRWQSVFAPEQLIVNTFEEVRDQPNVVLERLAQHLRIDPAVFVGADLADAARVRTDVGPMPVRVLERLEAMFAEPMRRFRDECGIDYTGLSREMQRTLG